MIPEEFLQRMQGMLGEEYESFLTAISEENVRAIRINREKAERETVISSLEEHLAPISYVQDGFICALDKIGNHPLHHAGAFYVQDPGAMAPLQSLVVEKGWRVADFCASPGGKSTQISSAIGQDGFLLSNEINLPRCKVLAGNMERLGVKNAVVTNLDTEMIARWFSSFFDLVVVDAPCSGEGMFRKYDVAQTEWTPDLIPMCAERQSHILDNAAKVVKGGGFLLYSTCTFSLEENEGNVDAFLTRHPDFDVCPVLPSLKEVTADGVAFSGAKHPEKLKEARRFYPHLQKGEGQFMCLLRKKEAGHSPCIHFKEPTWPITKEEERVAKEFLVSVLEKPLCEILPKFIIRKRGDVLYIVSSEIPFLPHHVYLSGVALGEVKKGRMDVHHHFFSAFGKYFARKIDLSPQDKELSAYLHGDTFTTTLPNGYAVVTVNGVAIGGVKVVDGVAKNHYPKGLRTMR